MEVERIDHIKFKTKNMERDTRLFEGLLGKKFLFKVDFSDRYGARGAFQPFPRGFELVEVTDKDKAQGRMHADQPEGICGIALKVTDIEKSSAELESMGFKQFYRTDLGPIKEAGFDAKKTLGVVIELIEFPGDSVESLLEEVLPMLRGEG